MKFRHNGKEYELEFRRDHKTVTYYKDGKEITAKSRYPFTTVTLREHTAIRPIIVTEAVVGCSHLDQYTPEKGRWYALEALSRILRRKDKNKEPLWPHEFRAAMWKSYLNRPRPKSEPKPKGDVIDGQVVKKEEGPALPLLLTAGPAEPAAEVQLQ